ncbi:phage tail spike protein [Paenibacillus larvae]|nr:phage tail spike protein [Paenibacillus larvae]MDT2288919.1 phage tail spike protein [Paenibacillus larvae]
MRCKQADGYRTKSTGKESRRLTGRIGPTALAAIQDIGRKFLGELRFRVELANGAVGNRYVDLTKRGRVTGARFDYYRNMRGIKRTEDSSDMVTALIGIGKADENGGLDTFTTQKWDETDEHPQSRLGRTLSQTQTRCKSGGVRMAAT